VPTELLEERKTDRLKLVASSTPHRDRRRAYESVSYDDDFEPDTDPDMNQDALRFVKGERVVHETFGSGAVVEISGFGRDLKVTVEFDEAGRKKLLLRYAKLEKDWP